MPSISRQSLRQPLPGPLMTAHSSAADAEERLCAAASEGLEDRHGTSSLNRPAINVYHY
ncbi:MAG: hypothetical protein M0007_14640 [Actinomycetota bacterium]|nr:hypothetical protein [Actinomycetota bacterium]